MATPSSFPPYPRPSCGACPGRARTPTAGGRASGQGDGVTQRPPDGVVTEKLECTLVCILTRSLVTVAAGEQGVSIFQTFSLSIFMFFLSITKGQAVQVLPHFASPLITLLG